VPRLLLRHSWRCSSPPFSLGLCSYEFSLHPLGCCESSCSIAIGVLLCMRALLSSLVCTSLASLSFCVFVVIDSPPAAATCLVWPLVVGYSLLECGSAFDMLPPLPIRCGRLCGIASLATIFSLLSSSYSCVVACYIHSRMCALPLRGGFAHAGSY